MAESYPCHGTDPPLRPLDAGGGPGSSGAPGASAPLPGVSQQRCRPPAPGHRPRMSHQSRRAAGAWPGPVPPRRPPEIDLHRDEDCGDRSTEPVLAGSPIPRAGLKPDERAGSAHEPPRWHGPHPTRPPRSLPGAGGAPRPPQEHELLASILAQAPGTSPPSSSTTQHQLWQHPELGTGAAWAPAGSPRFDLERQHQTPPGSGAAAAGFTSPPPAPLFPPSSAQHCQGRCCWPRTSGATWRPDSGPRHRLHLLFLLLLPA